MLRSQVGAIADAAQRHALQETYDCTDHTGSACADTQGVLFLGRAKQSWLVARRVLHMAKHSKAWNSAVIVWHKGKKMHGKAGCLSV